LFDLKVDLMRISDWIKGKAGRGREDETIELPAEEEPVEKIMVRVENLTSSMDVDRVERELREGNIVLLKVLEMQKQDLGQFKTTVEKLKRRCVQFGWDIVAISDGYLLMTPKFAKIARS